MADSYPNHRPQRNATNSSLYSGWSSRAPNGIPRRSTYDTEDNHSQLGLRALVECTDPLLELVFVHGLRGGSRSTWTANDDPATFWPQEWLPEDSRLSDVRAHLRIHSFGYDAEFADRRVNLNSFNDFGISLLESLVNGVNFKRDSRNPIVFVTHSLGGLVVKKALNHAQQNPRYEQVSRRFHTIFFLASPHRGAENFSMLSNIIRACTTDTMRAFSGDLEPNFMAIENINEDFLKHYHGTRIQSFYEMRPSFHNMSEMVVDQRCATLGLKEEGRLGLSTDHLNMCRFENMSDPNYIQIRDALANTFEEIIEELSDPDRVRDQMRMLTGDLDVIETEEEELAFLMDSETPETCEWLLKKPAFIEWRDAQGDDAPTDNEINSRLRGLTLAAKIPHQGRPPRFFWLTGLPGSGKSFLAGHIIRHLQDRECSFYFLKHSEKSRQSLAGLLKSIACQMARRDINIRRSLLSSRQEENFTSDSNEPTRIWRQLFSQKILRNNFQKRQYWVIDGLDEHSGQELLSLFAKIPAHLPFSIFLASRRDVNLERTFARLPAVELHIEINDSLGDIRKFLQENSSELPADDGCAVAELIDKLVQKSNGSFLWTRLTLQRLQNSWSDTAIDKVLDDVPDGMNELYVNILEDMEREVEKDVGNKELTKAILRWVVCAARPLTTHELQEALRIDVGQKVVRLERMIESLCGQLIVVEKQGRVQLVHDTARDFLLDKQLHSDFAIDAESAHGRLANKCLHFLINEHVKPFTPRRTLNSTVDVGRSSALQEYANLHFSDHVVKSIPLSSFGPMHLLERFLEKSVLSWIEYIARRGDLTCLTQTAKNLKTYLDRRIDFQAPLGPSMKTISDWATDLIRLVTVFGRHLLQDPSSIHRIIPPLCPGQSIINRKFGNPHPGIEVTGLTAKPWSDRISSVSFPNDHTTALACCEKRYAIGLRSGIVILYFASTCQESCRLSHGEWVKQLQFTSADEYIIVTSKTAMSLWNYETGQSIWRTEILTESLAVALTGDDATIIAATKGGSLLEWDVKDGSMIGHLPWTLDQEESHLRNQDPHLVFLSSELGLLALTYRNNPIALFDLADLSRPRYIHIPTDVTALTFNPVLSMIALGLFDGDVWTFGIWDLHKTNETRVDAVSLSTSADGKTMIAGTTSGNIQIHDFDTLALMYVISCDEEDIVAMVFAGNGHRFLDIRKQEFNVWEPSVLVRPRDNDDSTSEGQTSFSTAPSQLVQSYRGTDEPMITAMVSHHTADYVFCGKEDGSVTVYEMKKGRPIKELYSHVMNSVIHMDWNSTKEILVSSDSSSQIMLHKVTLVQTRPGAGPRYTWHSSKILERRLNDPVRQVLLSVDGEYLIVSTLSADELWTIDGRLSYSHQCENSYSQGQKWSTHPRHKRQLFESSDHGVHILEWDKHCDNTPTVRIIPTELGDLIEFQSRNSGIHFVRVADEAWMAYDNNLLTRPLVWPKPPSPSSNSAIVAEGFKQQLMDVAPEITILIGMFQSHLVFLNDNGWVCSMRLDEAGQQKPRTRHFPIPHCWQSGIRRLLCLVTIKGDVVVAKGEELAVVKRGLWT